MAKTTEQGKLGDGEEERPVTAAELAGVQGRISKLAEIVGTSASTVDVAAQTIAKFAQSTGARLDSIDGYLEETEAERLALDAKLDGIAEAVSSRVVVGDWPAGLYAKVARILGVLGEIPKNGKAVVEMKSGGTYSYDFVRQDDLYAALVPLLADAGIAVFYSDEIVSRTGNLVTVRVRMKLVDAETGETETLVGDADGTDYGDKAASKAKTTAVRYLLLKTFLVVSDVEPEVENVERQEPRVEEEPEPAVSDTSGNVRERPETVRRGSPPPAPRRAASPEARKETLRARISDLAGEIDVVQSREPGFTLAAVVEAAKLEYGVETFEALGDDELVFVGGQLRTFLGAATEVVSAADPGDYPPGQPEFALRHEKATGFFDEAKS